MVIQNSKEYGVSETLGYILIYSIILGTVLLGLTIGLPELQDQKDIERNQNIERAYDVLKTNIDDIVWEMELKRETEVKLNNSRLYGANQEAIILNLPNANRQIRTEYNPMVYETPDNTEFIYENGAVIRDNGQTADMIHKPKFQVQGNEVLIPFIEMRHQGSNISGSTRIIEKERTSDGFIKNANISSEPFATLTVTTTNPTVWKTNLEQESFIQTCTTTSTSVECTFDSSVDSITIRSVTINYRFI
jgi:hypothetical protein